MPKVRAEYLRALLERLSESIPCCVLHGFDSLPNADSDLDMAVADAHAAEAFQIVRDVSQQNGAQVLKEIEYDVSGANYIIVGLSDGSIQQLDFLYASDRMNSYGLTGAELVVDMRDHAFFKIPSPDMEAEYLLSKRSVKRNLTHAELEKLVSLGALPSGCSLAEAMAAGRKRVAERRAGHSRAAHLRARLTRVVSRARTQAGDYFAAPDLSDRNRQQLALIYRRVTQVDDTGWTASMKWITSAPIRRVPLTAYVFARSWPWIPRLRDPKVHEWLVNLA
jgi:hypothetical protein